MLKLSRYLAVAVALGVAYPAASSATSLNINFGNLTGPPLTRGPPESSYGAASAQVGYWNSITTAGPTVLKDLTGGALADVTVALSSTSSAVMFGDISQVNLNYEVNDRRLIQSHFMAQAQRTGLLSQWSVLLDGLDNGLYDLYVYGSRNTLIDPSTFLVNGVPQTNLITPDGGTSPLVEGVDFEIVKVLVSDHTIEIESGADAAYMSGLAGLQLVYLGALTPTPLPGALPLFGSGIGAIVLLIARRGKRHG